MLEEWISRYDKVLLMRTPEFFDRLVSFGPGLNKIIVLTTAFEVPPTGPITFQRISEDVFWELLELYFTYEFSDKIRLVMDCGINYGRLYHMVDQGIFTLEEYLTALLS